MRVTSTRPAKNGGYIHPLNGEFKQFKPRQEPEPIQYIDAEKLMLEFKRDTNQSELRRFADSLGISFDSLKSIGCERAVKYHSWAFPMFGGNGRAIGIRLRRDDGSKFAVRGSRQGIFMSDKPPNRTAYIVEGASDLCALISMGLYGFGRPQCCGCIAQITTNIARLRIIRVVIIADADTPGMNGAETLQKELDVPSIIMVPPAKDLREAYRSGLTSSLLESLVSSQPWTQPEKKEGKRLSWVHFNNGEQANVNRQ